MTESTNKRWSCVGAVDEDTNRMWTEQRTITRKTERGEPGSLWPQEERRTRWCVLVLRWCCVLVMVWCCVLVLVLRLMPEVQGDQDREAAAMDASMRMLKRTSEDMTM